MQGIESPQPFILQGSERFGKSGKRQSIYYPGDSVTQVGEAYNAEVLHLELIEKSAEQGFKAFRQSLPETRATILKTLALKLSQHQDALSQLITQESGKPIQYARQEVLRSVAICEGYAAQLERQAEVLYTLKEGRQGRVARFPVGPVLAITPFNFPLNLVVHKLGPAIAAGCSITIKPAPQTPLTALYLGRLAVASGYQAISVIPTDNQVAEALVQSTAFRKLSFTGSAAVGWRLRQLAGHKSVTLELGGNAPVIVEDLSVPIDELAQKIALGAFACAGQVCIAVQRILVNQALLSQVQAALVTATRALKVGDPFKPETNVGPMIHIEAVQRSRKLIKDALQAGANVVYGGNTYNPFTLNPTLLDRTTSGMAVNADEVFAPIATIASYETFEQGLAMANQSRFGLQAGIFTSNPAQVLQAFQTLELGGLIVNDVPTFRSDVLPYGGVKESGLGREGVYVGMDEYTILKTLIQ